MMKNFPDLTILIYFSLFGVLCAIGGGLWLLYHTVMAFITYLT